MGSYMHEHVPYCLMLNTLADPLQVCVLLLHPLDYHQLFAEIMMPGTAVSYLTLLCACMGFR